MFKLHRIRSSKEYYQKNDLAYLLIPKCMSTQMTKVLRKDGWKVGPQTNAKNIFAIIREPIDRWVSGLAQNYYIYPENIIDIGKNLDSYVKLAWHDPHTSKQTWYLDKSSIDIFRLDQLDLLKNWLKKKGNKLDWPRYEETQKNSTKEKLKRIIRKNLTDKHIDYLKYFYSEDVRLYEESFRT